MAYDKLLFRLSLIASWKQAMLGDVSDLYINTVKTLHRMYEFSEETGSTASVFSVISCDTSYNKNLIGV